MNDHARFALYVAALLACSTAFAQDPTRISFNVPASVTKYVAQHSLSVGDQPGHDVRIFEIVRTLGNDAPMVAGIRVKEIRSVGYSDYTDLNGPATSYQTITLENGDKIYARSQIVSHNLAFADKSKKGAENRTVGPFTGGTGKFVGIRGTMRNASLFDPKTASNASRFDFEYWLSK